MSSHDAAAPSDDARARFDDALPSPKEWRELAKSVRLFAYAYTGKKSWDEAEEIGQEAIRQALDPSYKRWNPVLQPEYKKYLFGLVVGIVANRRRKRSGRERPYAHVDLAEIAGAAADAVEESVAASERATKALAILRARVGDDRDCRALIAALAEGVDGPEAMAEATGIPVDQVRVARRRLARHLDAVLEELDREEARRG